MVGMQGNKLLAIPVCLTAWCCVCRHITRATVDERQSVHVYERGCDSTRPAAESTTRPRRQQTQ